MIEEYGCISLTKNGDDISLTRSRTYRAALKQKRLLEQKNYSILSPGDKFQHQRNNIGLHDNVGYINYDLIHIHQCAWYIKAVPGVNQ